MSSLTSANLALPYLAAAQAQKHITHNEALRALDAHVHLRLESLAVTAPPPGSAEGACWFVPAGASGDFLGREGTIAAHESGAWDFLACPAGTLAYVVDERRLALFDGTYWVSPLAAGAHGGMLSAHVLEEDVFLFGASVSTTIAIPDRAIVFGVSTRTLETVTGASAYHCGVAAEPNAFGGWLGVGVGNTNSGVIGPRAYYAPTPLLISAEGGVFTGGIVRVALHYFTCDVPRAEAAAFALSRPETMALVARMGTPPPLSRQWLIDRLVGELVKAGVWAKLDALYLLAAPDAQAARLNWISSAYGLTAVNSPAFTVDRGYASDGAAGHLVTGFVPGAGTLFQQDAAGLGTWVQENGRLGLAMGALLASTFSGSHIARYGLEGGSYCALTATEEAIRSVSSYADYLATGFYAAVRSGPNAVVCYRNGVGLETAATGSVPSPQLDFYLLGINFGGPLVNSTGRLAAAFMGASLTPAQMAAFHAALARYLTAIGAA
ncbi:hypothetical protein GCM10007301_10890 [Azorhizobium oxalatiphilum]|uniref:DUF2793 domain-containing protein n=1 Tax=Azorhizobium oxalatiphilum TaxID=980631 RepID=A0A917BSW5_9HYPH|nr:DUF2793 domain-containing protein [Azorhizobium oxalatiphilum]GGF53248.1 hypothetical protein GCM10007301_10890 [Azorhizobium oxalatiphilum]